ncbi:hypothetical protein I41_21130 [Lacipirellula limnantheis]|uniref:Uncharacterized protein n=1 Tax=Lacipirellula limnantheis TaxID=2528024 RepID=A0A517TX25_9BACT|nr:hypothetical protein I41_21130 [Lacipirellula limnantheis]
MLDARCSMLDAGCWLRVLSNDRRGKLIRGDITCWAATPWARKAVGGFGLRGGGSCTELSLANGQNCPRRDKTCRFMRQRVVCERVADRRRWRSPTVARVSSPQPADAGAMSVPIVPNRVAHFQHKSLRIFSPRSWPPRCRRAMAPQRGSDRRAGRTASQWRRNQAPRNGDSITMSLQMTVLCLRW